jgi:iron(III) transport system permease protein
MKRRGLLIPALIAGMFLSGYVLAPLWALLRTSLQVDGSFSLERYAAVLDFSEAANTEAVMNSVGVSVVSVLCAGVIGLLLAFVLTQFDFPCRRLLTRLAVLPVALPPLVGVIAFLLVFGESGILPRLAALLTGLQPATLSLDGLSAIIAIHVYSFYIYFYLLISSALRRLDGASLEAASVLGSGAWRTFRRVMLPQLRPALTGGAVLTFMASMASFSAPLLFAGSHRFLTLQIYSMKLNGDIDLAAAQSVVLTVISLVFFLALAVRSAREQRGGGSKGTPRTALLVVHQPMRRVLVALAVGVVVVGTLPLLVIGLVSFAKEGSWTWQLLPSSYTMENYALLFRDPDAFAPLSNSLVMAFAAAAGAIIIGVSGALVVDRGGRRGGRVILDSLLTLPYAIPGTVIALALILAFSGPSPLAGNQVLVGTFWILPLAYLVRTYPLVQRSATSALAQLDTSLPEAGELLGAGPWRRWHRIVLPSILPGIIVGALLVVITALGEFVSSVLLYTYASRPVSVEILAQLRNFNFGAAAAYCVLLLGVILLFVTVFGKISDRTGFPVR